MVVPAAVTAIIPTAIAAVITTVIVVIVISIIVIIWSLIDNYPFKTSAAYATSGFYLIFVNIFFIILKMERKSNTQFMNFGVISKLFLNSLLSFLSFAGFFS